MDTMEHGLLPGGAVRPHCNLSDIPVQTLIQESAMRPRVAAHDGDMLGAARGDPSATPSNQPPSQETGGGRTT
eukprot:510130-Pyramimonas_sp.AAC.1